MRFCRSEGSFFCGVFKYFFGFLLRNLFCILKIMMNRTEAEAREAFAAFRELRTGNLVTNHVFFSGCVEYGYPCQYNNGPCCCEPGCCPFGQEEKRLDDDFVEEQLAKLHLNSDITRAKENIRRARAIIQSW